MRDNYGTDPYDDLAMMDDVVKEQHRCECRVLPFEPDVELQQTEITNKPPEDDMAIDGQVAGDVVEMDDLVTDLEAFDL